MSIYEKVLGDDFFRLHPMLQKRYSFKESKSFKASGTMKSIKGGPKWLYPIFKLGVHWKLLFPERGTAIPFTIKNEVLKGENNEEQVHWERIFHFDTKKRYFNALMSLDSNRSVIKDYLGEPALVYSDLAFDVSSDGTLTIRSLNQRLILGKIELPLPKIFHGLATVTERYDEMKDVFQIQVSVRNPLVGHIFSYEGEFVQDA